jgi:hypothetical protein
MLNDECILVDFDDNVVGDGYRCCKWNSHHGSNLFIQATTTSTKPIFSALKDRVENSIEPFLFSCSMRVDGTYLAICISCLAR